MLKALPVGRSTYLGLFFVSLATLMLENLLTRIFSVTLWYHFAFVAISVALFGLTVGAVIVYLFPQVFSPEKVKRQLAASALLLAFAIVLSFLTQASLPFIPQVSLIGFYAILFRFVVISVPFVFSGICISLALTKFKGKVSQLYAADLSGAALGCLAFVIVLNLTDGPTAVIVCAVAASLGAFFFARDEGGDSAQRISLILLSGLALFAVYNTVQVNQQNSLLRLVWVKGQVEPRPIFEKWNPISRIGVWGDLDQKEAPFGFGISNNYPDGKEVNQLHLNIDASAETILTGFSGDINQVDYLRYDVTNLSHVIRPNASVLVVGSGGGRDILSALAFNQPKVLGVEINRDILRVLTETYGDLTGHLDQDARVTLVNDEARSYIARSKDRFDIIQVSLVDTWAATASGAYTLTENSLYTTEAFAVFLDHLSERGILTFSRWYGDEALVEMYRLTSLAVASLLEKGIQQPRDHILIYASIPEGSEIGIGTMMLSPSPFSTEEIELLDEYSLRMGFETLLTPTQEADETLTKLASADHFNLTVRTFPLNITPPTDESPFFFFTVRLQDLFLGKIWDSGFSGLNMIAVYILGSLLVIVSGLTLMCILLPMGLTTRHQSFRGAGPFMLYFAMIGMGFMLIEISQLQRLTVFLGHPTYSLTVVLFSLLLSCGIGSRVTARVSPDGNRTAVLRLLLLVGVVTICGMLTPKVIYALASTHTWLRVLTAGALLFPMGFVMGMAFPIGMKIATNKVEALTPWLWGINGATSILASVLAVALALEAGIAVSFWTGVACYLISLSALVWLTRQNKLTPR